MAQTNFTPILLYSSSTAGNTPGAANLTNSTNGSEVAINIADGRLFYKDTGGSVQKIADKLWNGTVTSVAALTLGTTGTDLSSTVANSTTTPVITLNVPTASATNRGALSSTDWSTFNGKQAALVSGTNIKTVGGVTLLGSGDVGTIGVGYGGTGTSTAFTAGSVVFAGASGVYSQDNTNFFWDNTNKRLGINTASPASPLDVSGSQGRYRIDTNGVSGSVISYTTNPATSAYQPFISDAAQHQWRISGVEAARINSNANLLVGATADQNARIAAYQPSAGAWAVTSINGSASGQALCHVASISARAPNDATSIFYYASDNAAARFVVYSNGGIANYQANNVNLSDKREKTNIELADSYLDKICAIPVKTFKYTGQSDEALTLGVIAQDVQEKAPELVSESDWSLEQDGSKMRLSIYQTDLQYALMKALQELNAKFDAYVASHP